MKYILSVSCKNYVVEMPFCTITQAYQHYVRNYATIGEKLYYLGVAHKPLSKVTNEDIMGCIFRHVFRNACISEKRH